MSSKNYTQVNIGGRVYTLGGQEDEEYLREVAAYLNEKLDELHHMNGFGRLNPDMQSILIQLNVSDDYFRARKRADELDERVQDLEKEVYELKHTLISTQMKSESLQEQVSLLQEEANSLQAELDNKSSKAPAPVVEKKKKGFFSR